MPYVIALLLSHSEHYCNLTSLSQSPPSNQRKIPHLIRRRNQSKPNQSLFDDIDRLRLDLDVGNVTPEEYERQMNALRHAAAENLRAQELTNQDNQDESQASQEVDDDLEERIRQHLLDLRQQGKDPS